MENHIRKILAGCRKNDRRSQKEFYQLFYKFVFAICYRYENDSSELEKLVNDSFIKIFKKINEFDDEQFADTYVYNGARIWIAQYILFACIENCRKSLRNHDIYKGQTELGYQSKFPVSSVSAFSNKEIIEAIRKLPLLSRVIYNLFVIDGMAHEKIAMYLGISVIDSRSTVESARKNFEYSYLFKNFLIRE